VVARDRDRLLIMQEKENSPGAYACSCVQPPNLILRTYRTTRQAGAKAQKRSLILREQFLGHSGNDGSDDRERAGISERVRPTPRQRRVLPVQPRLRPLPQVRLPLAVALWAVLALHTEVSAESSPSHPR